MTKNPSGKKKPAYEYGSYELDEVPDIAVDPHSSLEVSGSYTVSSSPVITWGISSEDPGSVWTDNGAVPIDVNNLSDMVAEKVLNMLAPKTPEAWIKKALEAGMTLPEIGRAVVAHARGNDDDGTRKEEPVSEMPRGGKGSKRR